MFLLTRCIVKIFLLTVHETVSQNYFQTFSLFCENHNKKAQLLQVGFHWASDVYIEEERPNHFTILLSLINLNNYS